MSNTIGIAAHRVLGTVTLIGVFCSLGILLTATTAEAEEELIGADEYFVSCRVCHGAGGKGDGPMTSYLTIAPSDLTSISKSNDGVFPSLKIFQIVDGRTNVGGHGVREMPVWGARYKAEAGDKYGPYGGEQATRARILELVFYIQAIQEQ